MSSSNFVMFHSCESVPSLRLTRSWGKVNPMGKLPVSISFRCLVASCPRPYFPKKPFFGIRYPVTMPSPPYPDLPAVLMRVSWTRCRYSANGQILGPADSTKIFSACWRGLSKATSLPRCWDSTDMNQSELVFGFRQRKMFCFINKQSVRWQINFFLLFFFSWWIYCPPAAPTIKGTSSKKSLFL